MTDLITRKPDVIGFSCYIWNIEETIKVIETIKKINPSIVIMVGGPEVSYDVHEWMSTVKGFDFIVVGEGEETFKSLLNELKGNHEFDKVSGIAYRRNDEVIINHPLHKLELQGTSLPLSV